MLSLCGLVVGLSGINHYGYMGQDFTSHRTLILNYPNSFYFGLTNPPGLYLFGSFIHNHVSSDHFLEIIALAFLAFNTAALWIIYHFLWMCITQWQLRYMAAALCTLIPFRIIHSVVLAADALTLPLFALIAVSVLQLFESPRNLVWWVSLSLFLSVGILCKYTFAGLLPSAGLLLSVAIWRDCSKSHRIRWSAIGAVSLAIPAGIFSFAMRESFKTNGSVTNQQWLNKGAPSIMRWSDILLPKENDLHLLRSAPEYMRDRLFGFRTYSYIGLLHVSAFSDVLNCFETPPQNISTEWSHRTQELFPRSRSPVSEMLQTWAVRWCIPFTFLAVIGTLLSTTLSLLSLFGPNRLLPNSTIVVTTLAVGFYSTVFFSLHRINDPYTAGFWLPRLVLPALLIFFCLGFVIQDDMFKQRGHWEWILKPFRFFLLGYTAVACLIFIGFLV